jgi:hypothetical protein
MVMVDGLIINVRTRKVDDMSQAKPKAKAKIPAPTKLAQSQWTDGVGKVKALALKLWNTVAKSAPMADDDIRMEHGKPSDFQGANCDDPAIIRQRDLFCAQILIFGNPYIRDYHSALAAWMSGLWKALATDVEGETKVKLSHKELSRIMTAKRDGEAKEKQSKGLAAFLTELGFNVSRDDDGYARFTLVQGNPKSKLGKLRAELIAELAALGDDFPVSISRPKRADLDTAKGTKGRNAKVKLITSCDCKVKLDRKAAEVQSLPPMPKVMAERMIGTPCPRRFNTQTGRMKAKADQPCNGVWIESKPKARKKSATVADRIKPKAKAKA